MRPRKTGLVPLAAIVLAGLVGAPVSAGATEAAAPSTETETTTTEPAAPECPAALPVAEVETGMVGRGLTVTRGQTPQPFRVEVLGVLPDAVGPGRDMIMVEVSDIEGHAVVSQGGGIWAGMSGSPVYVGDRLLGAIAFGFTAAPSRIGGITPAEELTKVLDYPTRAATAARTSREPARIAIPRAMQRTITATGTRLSARPSLERLPTPLGMSGLDPRRLRHFQTHASKAGLPVIAHTSGRGRVATAATASPMARPVPGGNFVAALSYGDITAAATGTTTMVCGDRAIAFGHPFLHMGNTRLGANDASALAIVKDDTFGSFKLATIGAPFGVVDQDRLAGVRGRLGQVPVVTPVRTSITSVATGRKRYGRTVVTNSRFLPALSFYGAVGAYDVVFDEIGRGTAATSWRIRGTRAGGREFVVRHRDKWTSNEDIALDASWDLAGTVDRLLNNPYEPVRITDVRYRSSVEPAFRRWRIVDQRVSVDGRRFTTANELTVRPGAVLQVRVVMLPYRSQRARTLDFIVRVPRSAAGLRGGIFAWGNGEGGGEEFEGDCMLDDGPCMDEEQQSLDTILRSVSSRPRNDQVALTLHLGDGDEEQYEPPVQVSKVARAPQVVIGGHEVAINVRG